MTRMDASPTAKRQGLPLPVILASLFVFVFCNLFSYFVFEHVPHVNDEIDYLFQAKLFRSARLYAPSPCARESFDFPHLINNGRWYSQYPPGFPFLLMIGLVLGAPWMINPLLASLAVIVFYLLGSELYGRRVGVLASLLGAFSMWFLVMSSTMMSHPASLFFSALFLLFLFRSSRKPSAANGVLVGASWGMGFLIRPYNTLTLSLPFLIYLAALTLRNLKLRWRNGCALALSGMIFIGLLLTYNQLTNGHPLRMGYVVSYGTDVLPGFGRAALADFSLTPLRGAEHVGEYLKSVNSDLFGWPLSSLLALLPLFWSWRMDSGFRKKDLLLLGGFISMLLGLYFYWQTFLLLGARHIFEGTTILVLLSARGILELPNLLGSSLKRISHLRFKQATAAVLIVFFAYAFLVRFPRWVWPKDTGDFLETIGHDFAGTTTAINRSVESLGLKRAVVILRLFSLPSRYFPTGGWGSGFLYNDPDLKGNVVYARYERSANVRLLNCFPGRNFYLYLGTLERGIFIPIEESLGRIIYKEPLKMRGQPDGGVAIVGQPKLLFTLYSAEFEEFLDSVYEEHDWADVDAARLKEIGIAHQKEGRFIQAAFCFETALQIENDPETRRDLLNLLIPCYQKTGQAREARKLIEFMEKVHFNERRMYAVFPERGF